MEGQKQARSQRFFSCCPLVTVNEEQLRGLRRKDVNKSIEVKFYEHVSNFGSGNARL